MTTVGAVCWPGAWWKRVSGLSALSQAEAPENYSGMLTATSKKTIIA